MTRGKSGDELTVSMVVRMTTDEHQQLKLFSDALGMSLNEGLRCLIPSLELPESQVVSTQEEIAEAASQDRVAVTSDLNVEELGKVLKRIHHAGAATTLAREIRQQLLERRAEHLTVETYKRLGRWIHPRRWTEREKAIQPLAQQLSRLLFGRAIERIG